MNPYLLFSLVAIASVAKAIMDTLNFKFSSSIFNKIKSQKIKNWFDPKESWKNKYKDGNKTKGEKFIGSSTVFVWLTDAWHFFQSVMLTALEIALVTVAIEFNILSNIVLLILIKVIRGFTFEIALKIFSKDI